MARQDSAPHAVLQQDRNVLLAAAHDRRLDGGTFEISLYDTGTGNQHCTNVNVDDLACEPGHFVHR